MMERSSMDVMLSGGGGGGELVLTSMKFAVLPIAKVFTMCFMGFLMASKYVGILPANGRKLLNGVILGICLSSSLLLFVETHRTHLVILLNASRTAMFTSLLGNGSVQLSCTATCFRCLHHRQVKSLREVQRRSSPPRLPQMAMNLNKFPC